MGKHLCHSHRYLGKETPVVPVGAESKRWIQGCSEHLKACPVHKMFKHFYQSCYQVPINLIERLQVQDHSSHDCRVNLVFASLSTHLDILRHREGLGTEVVNTDSTHAKIKHYQFPPCFSICFRSQLEQGQRSTNSLIFLILHHRTLLGRMKPALNLKGVKF